MIPNICPYCHEYPLVQNYGFDFWVIGCKNNRCINSLYYSTIRYANRMDAVESWNLKVKEQMERYGKEDRV